MKCSNCNFENSDNAKFCQECGSNLESQHKACTNEECRDFGKYILPLEAKFCPRCGEKIEGQKGSGKKEETNKANGKKKESNGYINGHEYVDLGLPSGLKWATCNVGANSPEEYGNYYAWGETYTKDEYDRDNCDLWEVEMKNIGGDPDYDVATSEWGEEWRLPTKEEFEELVKECEWKWMKKKGVNGKRVTGPNGKSIFLPAAGYRNESSLGDGSYGSYWSSTPKDGYDDSYAWSLDFFDVEVELNWQARRSHGSTVRPITE